MITRCGVGSAAVGDEGAQGGVDFVCRAEVFQDILIDSQVRHDSAFAAAPIFAANTAAEVVLGPHGVFLIIVDSVKRFIHIFAPFCLGL